MLKGKWKSLKEDSATVLAVVLLMIAFVIGTIVRIQYVSGTDYPVNDGGLFYQMVEDLLDNGLRIPAYTTYNNDQIPFAYPPLAFYLIAILKLISNQSLLQLFSIFPLAISILVIVAFYFFSSVIFKDRIKIALSVLFFALLPRTYQWFIMGGGATRGLGFLFAILALTCIWKVFSEKTSWKNIVGAIVFSAGCVLSHPETSLFVIFMAGVFFSYHQFGWTNFKKGLIIAAGVLICIAPWLFTLLSYHGITPFRGAGATGHGEWLEIKNFLTLNFGFENSMFLQIVSIFALLALFFKKDKLTYFLSASIVIGYFLFPRSGPNLLTMVIAPLAAGGFYEILVLSASQGNQRSTFVESLERSSKAKAILAFVVIYLMLGAFSFKYIIESDQLFLSEDLLSVYSWLEENADQDDQILIYPVAGADRYWWNDYATEWFPALTTKSNLTTVQGYEWVEGEYQNRVVEYYQLRTCVEIGPVCVDQWESRNGILIKYLVLGQVTARQDFVENFLHEKNYNVVYAQSDYLVLEKK